MSKNMRRHPFWFMAACGLLFSGRTLWAQADEDPFLCVSRAEALGQFETAAGLTAEIARIEIQTPLSGRDSHYYCYVAELQKRTGVHKALGSYDMAIQGSSDSDEGVYDFLLAEYMRNFRGAALRPVFATAERHYYQALTKLRRRQAANIHKPWDERLESGIQRGLVALYQRDGLPAVLLRQGSYGDHNVDRPLLFLTLGLRYAHSSDDLDQIADDRNFTSEALFSSSRFRLNRALTTEELRDITRTEEPLETSDRLRLRYKDLPVVDFDYTHRQTSDAQITSFYAPGIFNAVRLNDWGVSVEKAFAAGNWFDVYLNTAYHSTGRQGLIEFFPDEEEKVRQYEFHGSAARFIGPDKIDLDFTYVRQSIRPVAIESSSGVDIFGEPDRNRSFTGGTLTYSLLRPLPLLGRFLESSYEKRFETRGVDTFAGFLLDSEGFGPSPTGDVRVRRRDFFAGIAAKGLYGGPIDITVQPTWFGSSVNNDRFQDNAQYRTNVTVLYRIVDEETRGWDSKKGNAPRLGFVHLVVPLKYDVARTGLNAFNNYQVGAEMDVKWFSTARGGVTFLATARYDFQRFVVIGQNRNLFNLGITMGF